MNNNNKTCSKKELKNFYFTFPERSSWWKDKLVKIAAYHPQSAIEKMQEHYNNIWENCCSEDTICVSNYTIIAYYTTKSKVSVPKEKLFAIEYCEKKANFRKKSRSFFTGQTTDDVLKKFMKAYMYGNSNPCLDLDDSQIVIYEISKAYSTFVRTFRGFDEDVDTIPENNINSVKNNVAQLYIDNKSFSYKTCGCGTANICDCKRIQFDSEAFNSFVEKLAENFICKFNTYKVVDKMQYSYLSPIHVFLANDIFSISHQNIGKAVELSLEIQENIDDGLRQNAEALLKEHFESLRVAVEETLFKLSQDRQSQYVNN